MRNGLRDGKGLTHVAQQVTGRAGLNRTPRRALQEPRGLEGSSHRRLCPTESSATPRLRFTKGLAFPMNQTPGVLLRLPELSPGLPAQQRELGLAQIQWREGWSEGIPSH